MDDAVIPPDRFKYLVLLLQNLPVSVPERTFVYRDYKPTEKDYQTTDGTFIGALHARLEFLFGKDKDIIFAERGNGLVDVVAALEHAYEKEAGNKRILRRWVDKLVTSALDTYKVVKKTVCRTVYFILL